VTATEDYTDRVNAYLGNADVRKEWLTLLDARGDPVAELTEAMKVTGVAVDRADGTAIVQYMSAITDD